MEIFGNRYVIEHCISLFRKKQEKKILKVYITDGLKVITETLQGVYGGAALSTRYLDIIDPPPVDDRTADDIIENIKNKLQALGGEDNEPV